MSRESIAETFERPTVVEVWGPSCAQCSAMEPDIQATADRYCGRVDLVQLNVATQFEEVSTVGAMATPTIVGYRDGIEVFRHIGRRSAAELGALFDALESGGNTPRVGTQDLLIRVGAGIVLAGIGLATGPTWLLVFVGAVVGMFGVVSWLKS